MSLKISYNYSPNFDKQKRSKKKIKYLVIHYTGMKNEKNAINRLSSIQSEVSSHYFIKYNGGILQLVPDLYVAARRKIKMGKR